MADEQKTLIDITALKYFYKSLQNVTVLIAPSSVEAASAQNLGRTYFIPADGTYAGLSCKKGDHIVSNGTTWVLIPKGTSEGGTTYYAGTGIDISKVDDKDTITNTGVTKVEESDDAHKGTVKVTTKDGSSYVPVHGLGTAVYKTAETTLTDTDDNVATSKAVKTYVDTEIGKLPEPMVFKGSLGTGGTITTLPTAAKANKGFTYKVITDGTYDSQSAKVGDTFISDGSTWVLIPSGDEPSGTVTSVGVSVPTGLSVSNTPITTSGTIAISMASGYSIPTTAKQTEWDGKVPATRKVNGKALSADVTLSGADVAVTGYSKASTASAIAATDTVNVALGKVEKALDGKQNTLSFMTTPSSTNPVATKTEISLVENAIKGTADGQFITDENAVMTKTVPEKCVKGVVAKISGKTVKNLFNNYIDLKAYSISSEKYNGHQVITANNVQWNGAVFDTKLEAGQKYRFKAMVKSSNTSAKILTVWNYSVGNGSTSGITPPAANTWFYYEEVGEVKAGDTGTFPRIECNATSNVSIACMTVTKEADNYGLLEPGLNSAPVESVVSNSANLFNKYTCVDGGLETDGSVGSNSQTSVSAYIPVIGGETYFLNNVPNQSVARTCAEYDANKTFIKITSFSSPNTSGSITMSVNTRYIRTTVKRTDKNIATVNRGTTAMIYKSYNKTTVSVPKEVRNFVGYGLGISDSVCNIADFENGVYTQIVNEVDLGDLTWTYNTDYKRFGCSLSGYKKKSTSNNDWVANAICDSYEVGTGNSTANTTKKIIGFNGVNTAIYLADSSLSASDIVGGKIVKLKGVKLAYELETPVITPLTGVIFPFATEEGGTVTLVNEHNLDMPNTIIYEKEVL